VTKNVISVRLWTGFLSAQDWTIRLATY